MAIQEISYNNPSCQNEGEFRHGRIEQVSDSSELTLIGCIKYENEKKSEVAKVDGKVDEQGKSQASPSQQNHSNHVDEVKKENESSSLLKLSLKSIAIFLVCFPLSVSSAAEVKNSGHPPNGLLPNDGGTEHGDLPDHLTTFSESNVSVKVSIFLPDGLDATFEGKIVIHFYDCLFTISSPNSTGCGVNACFENGQISFVGKKSVIVSFDQLVAEGLDARSTHSYDIKNLMKTCLLQNETRLNRDDIDYFLDVFLTNKTCILWKSLPDVDALGYNNGHTVVIAVAMLIIFIVVVMIVIICCILKQKSKTTGSRSNTFGESFRLEMKSPNQVLMDFRNHVNQ